jgi:predicted type IV restriction endonuclease
MDFIDELKQFSIRVEKIKDQLKTEEATKTALIMPFFQLLGYDVFNPTEFVPEFVADAGIKKGEKVDYAIVQDDKPIILIEAKWCGDKLDNHDSQLFRYFVTTPSKFAILTNGIIYKVYTDLEEPNKMDEHPFLEFNLLDIKEGLVPEIKKFHKSNFDLETIFNSASELKYSNKIKELLLKQLIEPTDTFVNYILGEVYAGRKTQNVIEKFRDISKKSFNQFINELMNDRIKSALQQDKPQEQPKVEVNVEDENTDKPVTSKVLTTVSELEAFFIVKNVLREIISSNRITYKDTESYFGILLDNNTWKWICRLYLSETQKYIIIPDENKKGIKYNLEQIDDIYNYKEQLVQVIKRYI